MEIGVQQFVGKRLSWFGDRKEKIVPRKNHWADNYRKEGVKP
jgi:hypothetical protein